MSGPESSIRRRIDRPGSSFIPNLSHAHKKCLKLAPGHAVSGIEERKSSLELLQSFLLGKFVRQHATGRVAIRLEIPAQVNKQLLGPLVPLYDLHFVTPPQPILH